MADNVAPAKKSHGGLKFFLGFLTGILTLILVVVIAGVIVVQIYEPSLAKSAETILESYAGQSASNSLPVNVTIDFRTISYEKTDTDYKMYVGGYAHPASKTLTYPVTFTAKVDEANYNKLDKHVSKNGTIEKELRENYGLKGIVYAVIVFTADSTEPQTINYDGKTYPWTKESTSNSSSAIASALLP
jgi:hypothetical protein